MGLYNYVNYPSKCRKCGFLINSWQTKDDTIYDLALISVPIEDINEFHDICPKCQAWNKYRRIGEKLVLIDCESDIMEYVRCKKCQWSWNYTYDKDLKVEDCIIAKKGYYLRCPFGQGLYFEKEPVKLLKGECDNGK